MNKVGRPQTIKTPEELWDLFVGYRQELKDNPFLVEDYVGKDGVQVFRQKQRPLTDKGFYNYCREHVCCVRQYLDNREDSYPQFVTISRRIKETIDQNQIEGGMVGIFNASLTARIQGLADKQETTNQTNVNVLNIDPLGDVE